MAGHSHWAGIKHKKALIDNKRGKVWSKCSKAIIVAAKLGGGDPDQNLFETITPDSGGSIVADTTTDTLTLAGGTGVATVGTPGTDTVTFDTVDSEIVHDNLSGVAANEHVDHGGVEITAHCLFQGRGISRGFLLQLDLPRRSNESRGRWMRTSTARG